MGHNLSKKEPTRGKAMLDAKALTSRYVIVTYCDAPSALACFRVARDVLNAKSLL